MNRVSSSLYRGAIFTAVLAVALVAGCNKKPAAAAPPPPKLPPHVATPIPPHQPPKPAKPPKK